MQGEQAQNAKIKKLVKNLAQPNRLWARVRSQLSADSQEKEKVSTNEYGQY